MKGFVVDIRNWLSETARKVSIFTYRYYYLIWVALVGLMLFLVQPEWLPLLTISGWKVAWYVFLVLPAAVVLVTLDHYFSAFVAFAPIITLLLWLVFVIVVNMIFSNDPVIIDFGNIMFFK